MSAARNNPHATQEAPTTAANPANPSPTSEVSVEVFTGQSRVTVADADVPAADVKFRVSRLLSELKATDVPEGDLVTRPEGVLFDFDNAAFTPDASGVLDRVAEVIVLAEGRRGAFAAHRLAGSGRVQPGLVESTCPCRTRLPRATS